MGFSVALDWLSFTLKGKSDENKSILSKIAPLGERKPTTPRFGYELGFTYTSGVVTYSAPNRPEMGIHVIVSGSSLRVLEQSGLSCRALLVMCLDAKAKVTRLDLAKDAYNESIQLETIAKLAVDGKRTGSAQSVSQIISSGGGQTVYVGSRTSDRFARMYNKGAEQKTDDDWFRMEIECKGDVAKTLARVLAAPDCDWNATIGGIMAKMLDVNEDSYQRWLEGASIEGLPKIEKRTDRETWILTQVVNAVSDHIREYGETKAVSTLKAAIDKGLLLTRRPD